MFPQRSDNLSRNLAQEVNMLEHERILAESENISTPKRKLGIISFAFLLAVFCIILLLFIF